MNTKTLLWLSTFFMTYSLSFASGDKGNGADTVVCKEASGETIKLLDYYEANASYSPHKSSNLSGTRQAINLAVVEVVKQFDSYRAKKLKAFLENAEEEILLLEKDPEAKTWLISFTPTPLPDIEDEGDIINKEDNCEIKQLIYRRKSVSFGQARHVIYKPDFDRLSPEEQSMALSHEHLYGEAIERGAPNSMPARLLNGIYYSELAKKLSAGLYIIYIHDPYADPDLKIQFPYLTKFGGTEFLIASAASAREVESSIFGDIDPHIRNYLYMGATKVPNMVVPYYLDGRELEKSSKVSMFLEKILELKNDTVIAEAIAFNPNIPELKAVNGSIQFTRKCFTQFELGEKEYTDFHAKPRITKITGVKGDERSCLKIKIDNQIYDASILKEFNIVITEKPLLSLEKKEK